MLTRVDEIIGRHRKTGLLVDTNLLLVWLVGSFRKQLIPRFKNTSTYTFEDYELLSAIIGQFDILITTPHILSELSNLSRQMGEPVRTEYFSHLAAILPAAVREHFVPCTEIAVAGAFIRLGVADAGIGLLAERHVPVLTADLDLYFDLESRGFEVINFNHIRFLGQE